MKDTLKEIRYPLVALFLLTLLTAFTWAERQRLTVATLSVETKEIAKLLLESKPDEVALAIDSERSDSYQAQQIRLRFAMSRHGSTESTVEFLNDFQCSYTCSYQIPMVTGGSLQLSVAPTARPEFQEKLKHATEGQASWEKILKDKRESEELHRALKNHTYWAGKTHKPRPERASKPVNFDYVPKESPLLYIDVTLSNPIDKPPATIVPSRHFVITNVNQEEARDVFLQTVFTTYKPGKLTVFIQLDGRNDWEGPLDAKALTSAAQQDASAFGVTSENLDEVYREMRKKYEQQEVTLPGIGLTVSSSSFIAYAFGLALGLAAWGSFLLRRLRQTFSGDESEPWVLVEPIRAFKQAKIWDRPIAGIEILLFTTFHLVAFLTPVAIAVVLLVTGQFESQWLNRGAIALGSVMSFSMLANYIVVLWMANHSTPQRGSSSTDERMDPEI